MPRAALLSLHARVEGVEPSSWEDPCLAQLWGPRFSIYVVAKRDFALFSLGRYPSTAKGRRRAVEMAERLHSQLNGGCMTEPEVGRALGINPNAIKYAAPTGTVAIRWDGARAATVWTVEAPEVDPADARRELARRYLHVFGPATADGFSGWAGIKGPAAAETFASLEGSLLAARTPIGDAWLLADDEPAMRAGAPAAERRRVLPARRGGAGAARPADGSAIAALDLARVAGRGPGRRRDPRNLETRAAHRSDRRVGTPVTGVARRDRGRGRRPARSGHRPAHRGRVEHMSARTRRDEWQRT